MKMKKKNTTPSELFEKSNGKMRNNKTYVKSILSDTLIHDLTFPHGTGTSIKMC